MKTEKKKLVSIAVSLAMSLVARDALADASAADLPPPLPTGVYVLDEAADGWLHDHCAYRGFDTYSSTLLQRDGTILVLAGESSTTPRVPRVKVFRCAEQPAFATTAFRPAPRGAVACTEEKPEPRLCVAPLKVEPSSTPTTPAAPPVAVAEAFARVTWTAPVAKLHGSSVVPPPSAVASDVAPVPKKAAMTTRSRRRAR